MSVRVLHIIGQLSMGGSERQLYLLLKHLARESQEHHLAVLNPTSSSGLREDIEATGVPVHVLPDDCTTPWQRVRALYALARSVRPHIVHAWSAHANLYAGLVGRLVGAYPLGSLRGSIHLKGFQRLPKVLQYVALRCVRQIVVNAEALAVELQEHGIPRGRIQVLPNCVDLPESTLAPDDLCDLGIEPGTRVVGIVGNVRPVKNHKLFIQGLARVIRVQPDVRGVIVGRASDPDYANGLKTLIEREGMEGCITLAGFRTDVPRLVHAFDVFCLTSHNEGMPNAVMEAMAAGRPVVATRVGGVPELVEDGETGYLVPSGDLGRFAEAVQTLLDHPRRARRMGEAGRRRIFAAFSCVARSKQLGMLYSELTS